ncbi:TylF/MycF/NovP-related O-methyltransferase [Methylobacterium durans]|uniref:TylF/MycF/NovP-related O-methyltransferase n=1 Tax=Methylobacterium durans TaxID=2202825 RepID=UPI002AFEDFFF|nr:TylF/MycF/NovP-related O-methyltransferase [Methylobacterium durans]MEA1832984.1 TylF/MycF/NovP-related O-methyltransferase [Methylobacterium durans]
MVEAFAVQVRGAGQGAHPTPRPAHGRGRATVDDVGARHVPRHPGENVERGLQRDDDRVALALRSLSLSRTTSRLAELLLPPDDAACNLRSVEQRQTAAGTSAHSRSREGSHCMSHDCIDHPTVLRSRYLNLLESALTGSLIRDPSMDPWGEKKYDPHMRTLGRDWPSFAQTMIGNTRLRSLRHMCETVLIDNIPGDMIETGVWRGGGCIMMKGVLAAYGDERRKIFVADSFCGLPKPDAESYMADAGDTHHTFKQLAISCDEVKQNFRNYGLLDENVVFLEGWFKDTLPVAPIKKLAILRLDGDMYESTIQALDALYHKVSAGGFVIVDDYQLKPCAQAVHDFRDTHAITSPILPIDGMGSWWRV